MKKSELEAVAANYKAKVSHARAVANEGNYTEAIREATSAWELADVAMKHERSDSREPQSIEACEIVTELAPPALDFRALNQLEEFLGANKRLSRLADGQPLKDLAAARERLWDCHRLWTEIEREPGLLQSTLSRRLGKAAPHWTGIIFAWQKMRLLRRFPDGSSFKLSLATRLGQVVPGKCPECGKREEAPKAMLLEPLTCPKCKRDVYFVLLEG